jgi:hypothetical protein
METPKTQKPRRDKRSKFTHRNQNNQLSSAKTQFRRPGISLLARPKGEPPWLAKVSPGARRLDGGGSLILVSGHACRRCFCTDEARTPPPSKKSILARPPFFTRGCATRPHGVQPKLVARAPRQMLKVIMSGCSFCILLCNVDTRVYFFWSRRTHLPPSEHQAYKCRTRTGTPQKCSISPRYYYLLLKFLIQFSDCKTNLSVQ